MKSTQPTTRDSLVGNKLIKNIKTMSENYRWEIKLQHPKEW